MYKPKLVLFEKAGSFWSKISSKLQNTDKKFGRTWYAAFCNTV